MDTLKNFNNYSTYTYHLQGYNADTDEGMQGSTTTQIVSPGANPTYPSDPGFFPLQYSYLSTKLISDDPLGNRIYEVTYVYSATDGYLITYDDPFIFEYDYQSGIETQKTYSVWPITTSGYNVYMAELEMDNDKGNYIQIDYRGTDPVMYGYIEKFLHIYEGYNLGHQYRGSLQSLYIGQYSISRQYFSSVSEYPTISSNTTIFTQVGDYIGLSIDGPSLICNDGVSISAFIPRRRYNNNHQLNYTNYQDKYHFEYGDSAFSLEEKGYLSGNLTKVELNSYPVSGHDLSNLSTVSGDVLTIDTNNKSFTIAKDSATLQIINNYIAQQGGWSMGFEYLLFSGNYAYSMGNIGGNYLFIRYNGSSCEKFVPTQKYGNMQNWPYTNIFQYGEDTCPTMNDNSGQCLIYSAGHLAESLEDEART